MKKFALILTLSILCLSSMSFAMSPHTSAEGKENTTKLRGPANQSEMLDKYLNMQCNDLLSDKKDNFALYLQSQLPQDFCEIVMDENEMDDEAMNDISQSELPYIGEGTFSKLVEEYFNDYIDGLRQ
jgi:hypothetical protein